MGCVKSGWHYPRLNTLPRIPVEAGYRQGKMIYMMIRSLSGGIYEIRPLPECATRISCRAIFGFVRIRDTRDMYLQAFQRLCSM